MTSKHALLSLAAIVASILCCPQVVAQASLYDSFCNPSNEARTKVWWFHGETETTREGIDADLEAFKEKGLGGVVYYDQVHGNAQGALAAMSPGWWDMLKHAAAKAKQLGLVFDVAASNGYVAGGPWITEELGMQRLEMVDTVVTVRKRTQVNLRLRYPRKKFNDIAAILFRDDAAYNDVWMLRGSRKVTGNRELTVAYDAGKKIDVRTITYGSKPRGKGSMGAMNMPGKPQERFFGAGYVDLPPIGDLEYSNDGKTWKSAAKLQGIENIIGYRIEERTVNFPKVRARYFRVRLHDWVGPKGEQPELEINNIRICGRDKINNWEVKAGLRTEVEYPHADGGNVGAVDSRSFRDISGNVRPDGTVTLTLEPGTWHVMRFGHVATGGHTKHGRKNLLGLEADVMSAKAATTHYNHYFKAICDTLSAVGCRPNSMAMDSHEAGIANWTKGFERKFRELRGYDIMPWLPALEGYIIGDRKATEQVLLDFRKAIAETINKEYYATFARLCKRDGVEFTCQAMLNIEADNISCRGFSDKPQGEFWGYQVNGNYDCLDAASAAHLYGRNIASTEAFSDTPYKTTWDRLLRIANLAYCRGINEFVACAASYQPWLDRKYDDDNSKHPYIFHRLNPNWKTAGAFWEYQARCTQLLQTGRPVVDLCVYIGENPPLKTMTYKLPEMPEGFNFDVCTYDALMNRFTADGGKLSVKGGMSYKALVVQDRTFLSASAVAKIEELERGGVPVVWCNKGEKVADVMERAGIAPDMAFASADKPDDKMYFYHRATADADIYFVYNHSARECKQTVTLRTAHATAELWNPRTLERADARMNADKEVRLSLQPYGSVFIIAER